MKGILKNILISVGCAYIFGQAQILLSSDYLTKFLKDNLIMIQITLLAINTASLSIVLSKIRDLIDKSKTINSFDKTKDAMFLSIKEQICLIFLSLALLILNESLLVKSFLYWPQIIEIAIITCFVYSITILYDTATSVFVILSFNNNKED